jgi:hypothetical protein
MINGPSSFIERNSVAYTMSSRVCVKHAIHQGVGRICFRHHIVRNDIPRSDRWRQRATCRG